MSIASTISRGDDIAIFTRNHPEYIEEACTECKKNPARRITFRAGLRWVAAANALEVHRPNPLDLYIAPIGTKGVVEFIAKLHSVLLDPEPKQPRTKELLALELDSTKGEDLWHDSVATLYVIGNCQKLKRPFDMNELVKVSDKISLSVDYAYSYSIVYARASA